MFSTGVVFHPFIRLLPSLSIKSLLISTLAFLFILKHHTHSKKIKMEPETNEGSSRKGKGKKNKQSQQSEAKKEIPPPPQSPTMENPIINSKEEEPELMLLGSREAERNLLIVLNKRLEKIIERNRQLQQANNQLMTQLEIEKQECSAKVTEVTSKVNGELEKTRDDLANVKKELTVMTFTLGATRKQVEDLQNKLQKSDDECARQRKKIDNLEDNVSNLTNQLKKEKDHKNKLERDLKDWTDEAVKLGQVLQDTKTELEREILDKLELEKELRGQIDERSMKTTLIETEMVQLKASTNQMLHDQNEKQQKAFENILDRNMKNLREEYTRKLIENKEEQAKLYEAKERDHISKKETLLNDLKKKGEEFDKAQKEAKALTESVRKLESERHALLIQLDDLESEKKAEREKLQNEISNRDTLIETKISEQNELLTRCQHLLDIKVALDNELACYKSLLETEESRLELGEFGKKDENGNLVGQQAQTA